MLTFNFFLSLMDSFHSFSHLKLNDLTKMNDCHDGQMVV